MNMKWNCAIGAVAGMTAVASLYDRVIRPEMNRWGSTADELTMPLPLDERVETPRFVQQLAVTIDATPAEIWPWIVQMGEPPRAGYYSFTSIEKLMGLDVVNQEMLLPEFQELRVGEAIDKAGAMTVLAIEPGHHLVLGPPPTVEEVQATWLFYLDQIGDRSTRLITRCRADWELKETIANAGPIVWAMTMLIEPGAFIMSWKMLRTIKRLAEKRVDE